MLVKNVEGERRASSMVKDSGVYIEIAKFVQAYTTIINNPNIFLNEVGEPEIEEGAKLNWQNLVKIMQTCDFGFSATPAETDLLVYYNYALAMGSLKGLEKQIASVAEISDAQKHYYNFIEDSTDKTEQEYIKQHQISLNRDREARAVDSKLAALKAKNITTIVTMVLGTIIAMFGVLSCLVSNALAVAVGAIFGRANVVGGIIFIVLGLIIFLIGNNFYLSTRFHYLKFKDASMTILQRADSAFNDEVVLKRKLGNFQKDLKVVQAELADETKSRDVAKQIETLVQTNKYYKELVKDEEFEHTLPQAKDVALDEDFAPIKLTKEQEENLRHVSKEEILLEGKLDSEAYNEKFEKSSRKKSDEKGKEESGAEKQEEQKEEENKFAEEEEKINSKLKKSEEELERQRQIEEEEKRKKEAQELNESVDMIKGILGINKDEKDREK